MSLSDAENKANAQAWEREHGAAFIRSVYPAGIPREMLESFGVSLPDNVARKPPLTHVEAPRTRRKGKRERRAT